MRKIAVSLTKGGVGKTTTAVNLAAGLAMRGAKVLLVDTDTQGHAGFMLGLKPQAGLAELIAGEITPAEALLVEARERLWLLAGGRSLSGVKRMVDQMDSGGELALTEALLPFEGAYDYVILDTSPGWDTMIINVLFYALEVLVPVSLEALTLKGLAEFNASLAGIRTYKAINVDYIVPTFLDGRVRKSHEVFKILQMHYEAQLCPPVRYNVRLSESSGHGMSIYEYAPHSAGAQDYFKLVERIAKDGRTQKNT